MTDLPTGFRAGFALPQVFPDGTIDAGGLKAERASLHATTRALSSGDDGSRVS